MYNVNQALQTTVAPKPQSTRIDLSILIVNWNTPDDLAACLRTVSAEMASLPAGSVETFVVDNASSDHSVALVREQFPWAYLIENEENVGFARANNQAARLASGRYVLLLNSDTELYSDALRKLIAFMDAHPEAGAVGARLLNTDGTLQISSHPAPTLFRELWYLCHLDALVPQAIYPMEQWPVDRPRQVEIIKGACLMLRHDTLEEVGLLDPDYFMYSEEVDLCKRVLQAGWQLHWEPRAVVVHHGGRSTQQVAFTMFMHLYRGKILYFRKRHGRAAATVYKLILGFASLLRIVTAPVVAVFVPEKRAYHRELARRYAKLLVTLPAM